MNGSAPAIALSGLGRNFGDFTAVRRLDLHIGDGEFFSLIGPSGCGKTTTLRMIAGLETPSTGTICVHGRDITDEPSHRRPVNTVFQNYALFPHLDVFDNVAFGLRERRMDRAEIRTHVGEMLELVDLRGREKHKPRQLSGGQQQRVALARALVLRPEVLLLDEPLGALDLKLRRQMQLLIKEVQREVGITFVYVTHDQEEAFSMSTRVGVMNRGELEQVDVPRVVYRSPASAFVADFVGASNHVPAVVQTRVAPGCYRVAIDGLAEQVECPGPDGLGDDTEVLVVIRPEAMTVRDAPASAVGSAARIVDASYSGPSTIYSVESELFGTMKVAESGEERALGLDASVRLAWDPSRAWIVTTRAGAPTPATAAT